MAEEKLIARPLVPLLTIFCALAVRYIFTFPSDPGVSDPGKSVVVMVAMDGAAEN